MAVIKSFFGFLADHQLAPADPSMKLVRPEIEHQEPRVLREPEYKALQIACRHQARDSSIIELLLQTAMRLSELSRLNQRDIQLPTKISKDRTVGAVHILGTGRKERTVTLNRRACQALRTYLLVRPSVEDPALFLSRLKQRMRPRAIQRAAEKHLNEARICSALGHRLRHAFATHHARQKSSLEVVRQALGHADLPVVC